MSEDERTLEILKLITSAEHHFNNLCFNIRALASTWLLATLAGTGWILKDLPVSAADSSLVVGKVGLLMLLCVGSSIGILVLWVMDIMVYQRLLNVWFDSREPYEKTAGAKLPQIRHNMKSLFSTGRATELIVFYYLALIAAPCLLSVYIGFAAGEVGTALFVLLIAVGMVVFVWMKSPVDRRWIQQKLKGS